MNIPWPTPRIIQGVPEKPLLQSAFEVVQRSGCKTPEEYKASIRHLSGRGHFSGRTLPWADPEFIRRAFVLKDAVESGDEARVRQIVTAKDGREI